MGSSRHQHHASSVCGSDGSESSLRQIVEYPIRLGRDLRGIGATRLRRIHPPNRGTSCGLRRADAVSAGTDLGRFRDVLSLNWRDWHPGAGWPDLERRRYIIELQNAHRELARKYVATTTELEVASQSLDLEMAQRKKSEESLFN